MSSYLEPDTPTVSRLQQLLLALSCHLPELPPHEARRKLQRNLEHQPIIPVYRMINGVKETKLMRLDWDFWFYADNKRYFEAFDGTEVWLAAFTHGDWSDMRHLHTVGSEVFGRRERRLSKAAKETKAGGRYLKLSEDGTRLLAWKGIYLRRIATQAAHTKTPSTAILQKTKALLNLEVWGGASLEARPYVEWRQKAKVTPIYGKNVPCRVSIEPSPDGAGLRICFQEGLIESRRLGGAYYDLARDLAEYFGDRRHSLLMGQVLHEDEPQQIEELLTKHGVGPCEDERAYRDVTIQLAAVTEPDETGVPRKVARPNERSSKTETADRGSHAMTHEKEINSERPASHHPAMNIETEADTESVPALQINARKALSSSVKKAKVAGTVPSRKAIKDADSSYANDDRNVMGERSSRMQIPGSLESANPSIEDRDVGLQGEYFMYRMLKAILGNSFDAATNWTSELRQFAGREFSAWQPAPGEEDASDFTFYDKEKVLLKWLLEREINVPSIWQQKPLTFHIEVKGTTRSCDEIFHLSRLQKMKAARLTTPSDSDESLPEDLFVIFRVYKLSTDPDGEPGLQIYIDPFRLIAEGVLQCEAEGWLVGPA
ncbi:hypothetical protein EPUS_04232 [Endocarpon pusillum Z07020]|uniref:Protein NO VEIN C-terminal domain-containing protein n=1 Tax=Endocarpon pusillum (strain Z07020 / HMAS-L-300199) TaxID=1263415 RepID=U1G617_ENDPU|nr:uncharacterized protein EPUS_04232 [Endocarpon pusillum Z07020]ERF72797.1 hypothetical protein EPUS_04232 [Endocarpon pusillum Z07020]